MNTCPTCNKSVPYRPFTLYGDPKCCLPCIATRLEGRMGVSPETFRGFCQNAHIPDRFFDIRPGKYLQRAEPIVAKAIKQHLPICLPGIAGTGKTLTLALYAQAIMRRGMSVRFYHYGDLADKLRQNNSLMGAYQEEMLLTPHLILDDVGSENDKTGWWTGWMGAIINQRYNKQQPVSSSMNDPAALDQRICRRLREDALVVEMEE